jgi:hypothetical protein
MLCLILSRLRKIAGRCRRGNDTLRAIQAQLTRMEIMMSDTTNEVLARLEALETQVNARTTQLGEQLAAARKAVSDAEARGRAAQSMEDKQAAEAEKQANLAKIDQIAAGLVEFTASGN